MAPRRHDPHAGVHIGSIVSPPEPVHGGAFMQRALVLEGEEHADASDVHSEESCPGLAGRLLRNEDTIPARSAVAPSGRGADVLLVHTTGT